MSTTSPPHDPKWKGKLDALQEAADFLHEDAKWHTATPQPQDPTLKSEMNVLRAEVLDVLFRLRELANRDKVP